MEDLEDGTELAVIFSALTSNSAEERRGAVETIEATQPRRFLLERLCANPRATWNELPYNVVSKTMVLAALARDPYVFGRYPWDEDVFRGRNEDGWSMPRAFLQDREVLFLYIKGSDLALDERAHFVLPEFARDDKEIILALCSKYPLHLGQASPRLADDEQVVRAALVQPHGKEWFDDHAFQHASERLRGHMGILELAVQTTERPNHFGWLRDALLRNPGDEAKVALEIAQRLRQFDAGERWLFNVFDFGTTSFLSDKDVMMQFVELHCLWLEFCKSNLREDVEVVNIAMAQNPGVAVHYSRGEVHGNIVSDADLMTLLATQRQLTYNDLPETFQTNDEIGLIFLMEPQHPQLGRFRRLEYCEMHALLQNSKSFALAALQVNSRFFLQLPESLQVDQEIAHQALNCIGNTPYPEATVGAVLSLHPSFLDSRNEILALVLAVRQWSEDLSEITSRSGWFDNEIIVSAAVRNKHSIFPYASKRLRSNRNVVLELLSHYPPTPTHFPLASTSDEFQLQNIDLVVEAIEVMGNVDHQDRSTYCSLSEGLLVHRRVVLACLERGQPVLYQLPRSSPFRQDRVIVKQSVDNDWSDFQYASTTLQNDPAFVLSLASIDGRVLLHAAPALKYTYDILVAATATADKTAVTCFSGDDYEFLVSFAVVVRKRLELLEDNSNAQPQHVASADTELRFHRDASQALARHGF